MTIRISEVYQSNQGEGLLTGTSSVFVRFSGCNLRCSFCDTPFASWNPEGESYSLDELVDSIKSYDCRHIVITGGEPMIFSELGALCERLQALDKHITIETAGTVDQLLPCDLISISPKMANSVPRESAAGTWHLRHEQRRCRPQVVNTLIERHDYQIKFVVDQADDLPEIESYLQQLVRPDPQRILLMPQGTSVPELDERVRWLAPYCQSKGWQLCDRMHIRWYGNKRGT